MPPRTGAAVRPVDACDLAPSFARRRLSSLGGRMFGLGLVLGSLATVTGSRILLGAGLAAAFLPWLALLTAGRPDVVVTVDGPDRTRVGGDTPIRLRIVNAGRVPLPPLELRCVRPLFASVEGALPAVGAGASTVWEVHPEPLARGISTHLHVEVCASDAFGLSVRRLRVLLPQRIAVAPRSVPLPAGVRPERDSATPDPGNLRPWRPGDAGTTVAWRPTARRLSAGAEVRGGNALVVREWAQDEPGRFRVAVTGGSYELAERALEVLAAVTLDLLDSGRTVEVQLGGRPTRPIRAESLLDALAAVGTVPTAPPEQCDLLISGGPVPALAGRRCWMVDAAGRVRER